MCFVVSIYSLKRRNVIFMVNGHSYGHSYNNKIYLIECVSLVILHSDRSTTAVIEELVALF